MPSPSPRGEKTPTPLQTLGRSRWGRGTKHEQVRSFFCLFFEELLRMSEENERGRIFTDSWSESDRGGKKRKKTTGRRRAGREGGKGGCIFFNFPENISYLRWWGGGKGRRSRRGQREEQTGVLVATARTSSDDSTSQALFIQVRGSERAGGWRGQPLSDVDSVGGGTETRWWLSSLQHATRGKKLTK